jgi:hypothetical protein
MLGIFGLSEPHDLDVSFGLLIYIGLVFCFSLSKNLDIYNRQESFHDYVDLAFLKRLVVGDRVQEELWMCFLVFFGAMMPLEKTTCFYQLWGY